MALLTLAQLTATLSQLNRVTNHPKQILLKRIAERKVEQSRMNNLAYAGSEFIKMRDELREPEPSSVAGMAEAELRALTGEIEGMGEREGMGKSSSFSFSPFSYMLFHTFSHLHS